MSSQTEAEAKWLRMQNPKSAEDYGLVMTEDELKQIPEGRQIIEDVRALRELRQTRGQGDE